MASLKGVETYDKSMIARYFINSLKHTDLFKFASQAENIR